MKKSLSLLSVLLIIMMFFASIGGVYATWMFAGGVVQSEENEQHITISEFTWEPEEILPTVTPGQNFLDLHQSILENIKVGLNSSKGALEDAIVKDKLVHSSKNLQGGNMKHLFITQETRDLDFLIQYVSNTEFHLYMYKSYFHPLSYYIYHNDN